jgi:hypothetical protein
MPIHVTTDQFTNFVANKWLDFQHGSDNVVERNIKLNAVKYNVLVSLYGFFTLNGVAMVVGTVFRLVVPSTAILWAGIGLLWRGIAERQIEVFATTNIPKEEYTQRKKSLLKSWNSTDEHKYMGSVEGVSKRVEKIFRNCLIPPLRDWAEDEISVFGYSLLKNLVPMPQILS